MSKILVGLLAVGAFVWAVWLVFMRRRLPNPKGSKGVKRRFIVATLLFVGLIGVLTGQNKAADGEGPGVMCYVVMPIVPSYATKGDLVLGLKAVWRTLDASKSEEFCDKLEEAAGWRVIRWKTAKMLGVAFSELAYHKARTRNKGALMVSCYEMTSTGAALMRTRENALKQVELLRDVRESGVIDEETALKAHAALARDLEMFGRLKLEGGGDRLTQQKLIEDYEAGKLAAGDAAVVAAEMIVEMEEGDVPFLTASKRLEMIKEQVKELVTEDRGTFTRGPAGNDWEDPAINPNMSELFEKTGLIDQRSMVTCYFRFVSPVKERSEELAELQRRLLDANVEAGVLDVEVAEKALEATMREGAIDYATEGDVRDYQEKVRRVMRILYKYGEAPSSFVEEVARAVDIDIIEFDESKALRDDVRWHLRSIANDDVMKGLEERGLVPAAVNHRLMMQEWRDTELKELLDEITHENTPQERLAEFEALIDSEDEFAIEGDEGTVVKMQPIEVDVEYRLKIRRVCRAFMKCGMVNAEQLKEIEEVIGVRIFSVDKVDL